MVEVLVGFGIPADKICKVLDISTATLYKYFAEELERGAARVEAEMVGNLFRLSKGNDGTALKATIFTLCTRFGYSQYAPRVIEPEPVGKKQQAIIDAQTAHEDSEWSDLVH